MKALVLWKTLLIRMFFMARIRLLTLFTLIAFVVFGSNDGYQILVGTYTQGTASRGIYLLKISKNGDFVTTKLLATSANPSFLTFSPDKKMVYAVNEQGESSAVSAFNFETKDSLRFVNSVSSRGDDPCYVTATNSHVFVANYSSGSISIFERSADGALSDAVQVVRQVGKYYGNRRMGPSNTHQVLLSPNGKYLLATNLGNNQVYTYRFAPKNEGDIIEETSRAVVKPKSGPRHITISEDGRFAYLVHELDASITVFAVSPSGELEIIQETSLVTNKSKENGAADIHLSPNGKFLYASNRGECNNITCFKVQENGKLKFLKQYKTEGIGPRNFTITPDGNYLIVGNQRSNTIALFSVNSFNGNLKLKSVSKEINSPVCFLLF